MSHTVTIRTQIRDFHAIQAACERLKLPQPTQGDVRLFDRVAQGIGVQLDDWRFPVCIDSDGKLLYDNFGVSVRRKTFLERLLALWFFGTTRRFGDAEQAERKSRSEVAGDCCWAPG